MTTARHDRGWLYATVWIFYLASAVVTLASLPICYAPRHARSWAERRDPRWKKVIDGPLFSLTTIDRSGASVIAVTLFLGVYLKHLENRRRFASIRADLDGPGRPGGLSRAPEDSLLHELLDRKVPAVRLRLEAFARELHAETSVIRYENYLVVLGLLGTLAGFLLGFFIELRQVTNTTLQASADNLLMVVGTATLSSIMGIGLGMIFVRSLAERDALEVDRIVGRAAEVLEGTT